jgi:hypothetical protein
LTDQRGQSRGRVDAAADSSRFELLDLFVRSPVDLIELRPSVIDQLRNLIDDAGHPLVEVGLIHQCDGVPHVHGMHAINHAAGVVQIKPVSDSADPRRGICVGLRLLVLCVRDV